MFFYIWACSGFYLIVDLLEASKVARPYKTSKNINANKTSKVKNFFARMNQKVSDSFASVGGLSLAAA
jgi:hypothetical protein